jgi:hypothetical protein
LKQFINKNKNTVKVEFLQKGIYINVNKRLLKNFL